MYSSVQIQTTMEPKNCQVNYTLNDNYYVYSGQTGMYIQNDLNYIVFNTTFRHFKYIRDVLPVDKTLVVQFMNIEMYEGTEGTVIFHSYANPVSAVFYRELQQAENHISIDLDNRSLITNSGESYPSVVINRKAPVIFSNQNIRRNSLIFVNDGLFVSQIDPRYERLLYPFSLTEFRSLQLLFEDLEWESLNATLDYVSSDVSQSNEFELHRPRYLFGDLSGNWWKWNVVNEQWTQISPSGQYFTFSEFISAGNTFTEYLTIPIDEFESKFSLGQSSENDRRDYVKVLMNNYVCTAKLINHKYWIDNYDSDQYLYILNKDSKATFIIGSI